MAPSTNPRATPPRLMRMQRCVAELLRGVGEDVEREGLLDTPKRVAKALLDVTVGYQQDAESVIGTALFHEPIVLQGGSGVVLVRDIDFASTSEATLLPFHGRCHVAYVPAQGVVLGLSKLARLVRLFAKRLQLQQRLGAQVAAALHQTLECSGVAVVLEARHLEATPQPPELFTACASGCFAEEDSPQLEEVLLLLGLDEEQMPQSQVQRMGVPMRMGMGEPSGQDALGIHDSLQQLQATSQRLLGSSSATSSTSPSVSASTPDLSEKDSEKDVSTDGDCDGDDDSTSAACEGLGLAPEPSSTGLARARDCGLLDSAAVASPSSAAAPSPERMEAAVQQLLVEIGEDCARPELQSTARRYVESLLTSTSGYRMPLPPARKRSSTPQAAWSNSSAAAAAQQQDSGGCACCNASGTPQPSAPPTSSGDTSTSSSSTAAQQQVHLLHFRVPFSSQCEHHMLPFYGFAHVAVAVEQRASSGHSSSTSSSGTLSEAMAPAGCCDAQQVAGDVTGVSELPLSEQEVQQVVRTFTQRLQVQERITHQVADVLGEIAGDGALGLMVVVDASHMCMVARGVENHAGRTMSTAVRGLLGTRPDLRRQVVRQASKGGSL